MKVANGIRIAITTLSLGGVLGLSALTATVAQADTQGDPTVQVQASGQGSIGPIAIGFIVGANILATGGRP